MKVRGVFVMIACLGMCLTAPAATILVLNLDRNDTDTAPDPNSSTNAIKAVLDSLGYTYDYLEVTLNDHATLAAYDYSCYELVFIGAGVTCLIQRNHRFDAAEGQRLVDYLEAGGQVYMDGGDVWYQDTVAWGAFDFRASFHYTRIEDGSAADLYGIHGINNYHPVLNFNGKEFLYGADNCFMDKLSNVAGVSQNLWENWTSDATPVKKKNAVSFDGPYAGVTPYYRTIACGFEFCGIQDGTGDITRLEIMTAYLSFFDVEATNNYGELDGAAPRGSAADVALMADYLAGNISVFPAVGGRADTDHDFAENVEDLVVMINFLNTNIGCMPFVH